MFQTHVSFDALYYVENEILPMKFIFYLQNHHSIG